MTDLIACISSEKKHWNHILRLINEQDWKQIFVIGEESSRQDFNPEKKISFLAVDFKKPVSELIVDIRRGLAGKFTDLEVALNLVSGNGKEHMAIIAALLKLGVGIRLMAVTKDGIREL